MAFGLCLIDSTYHSEEYKCGVEWHTVGWCCFGEWGGKVINSITGGKRADWTDKEMAVVG